MHVIGPNFRFLHVPKTGGTWVVDVLGRWLGLPLLVDTRYGGHATLANALGDGLPTLVYVRSPWTWIESFYRERTGDGWRRPPGDAGIPLDRCGRPGVSFGEFVRCMAADHPTWLPDMFHDFTGFRNPSPLVTVGRYETLAADLGAFLDSLGIAYDPEALAIQSRVYVNRSPAGRTPWTAELVGIVAEVNREVFDAFGFCPEPPNSKIRLQRLPLGGPSHVGAHHGNGTDRSYSPGD